MQPSSTCHNAIVLAIALFFSVVAKGELVPPDNPTYSEMDYLTPGDLVDAFANASGNNRCTNQDLMGFIPRMNDGAFSEEHCTRRCADSRFGGIHCNVEAVRMGSSLYAECMRNSMSRFAPIFEEAGKRIRLEPRDSIELESRSDGPEPGPKEPEPEHDEPGHDEPGHDEPEPEHDEPQAGHDEPGHDEPEPGHDEPGHDEPGFGFNDGPNSPGSKKPRTKGRAKGNTGSSGGRTGRHGSSNQSRNRPGSKNPKSKKEDKTKKYKKNDSKDSRRKSKPRLVRFGCIECAFM